MFFKRREIQMLLFSPLFLGCSSLEYQELGFPSNMMGHWGGVGLQDDGSYWQIAITLDNKRNPIEFPKLSYSSGVCEGRFIFQEKHRDVYHVIEKILSGDCDTGNVTLVPVDNLTIKYTYHSPTSPTTLYLKKYSTLSELKSDIHRKYNEYEKLRIDYNDTSNDYTEALVGAVVLGGIICWVAGCFDDETEAESSNGYNSERSSEFFDEAYRLSRYASPGYVSPE